MDQLRSDRFGFHVEYLPKQELPLALAGLHARLAATGNILSDGHYAQDSGKQGCSLSGGASAERYTEDDLCSEPLPKQGSEI